MTSSVDPARAARTGGTTRSLRSSYVQAQPPTRPLKIFSSDPMLDRTTSNRITIDVVNEPLQPGPQGTRVEVIDYDGENKRFYLPVDLEDPAILKRGGLDPAESDPRFHQQMVYAVAMKVVENFERALGRTIEFRQTRRGYQRLRLLPHAFYGANAYYDRKLNAVLFGYFRADREDPGPNLPGQTVFTCLSHDIIVHEVTHAVVDRLRPFFLEASNEDVLAFHEGFSDIVALFQHFSFHELLREYIQQTRGDLRSRTPLVELARQFGFSTGSGRALRSALDKPDDRLLPTTIEPHLRGSVLVGAVFDAFFSSYQRRIRDLIRIATGGTGNLPQGDLHPDLVNRIATEASKTAQQILTMCIRAFEYLPPVDVTFGDYLRALVTADYELVPEDEFGVRGAMIEAFRQRSIYAENVASLAEESLLWEPVEPDFPKLPVETVEMVRELTIAATSISRSRAQDDLSYSTRATRTSPEDDVELDVTDDMAVQLHAYAVKNAVRLSLDPNRPIQVNGFHPVFRVAPNGRLLIELVAQFLQQDKSRMREMGGLRIRGGTTLIASADGRVRYAIAKPLPSPSLSPDLRADADARLERQQAYLRMADVIDPQSAYMRQDAWSTRMSTRMDFRRLHLE